MPHIATLRELLSMSESRRSALTSPNDLVQPGRSARTDAKKLGCRYGRTLIFARPASWPVFLAPGVVAAMLALSQRH